MDKDNIRVLKEFNLNKGITNKDVPVYPVTKESAVITKDGKPLDEKLESMQEDIDNCVDSTEATEIILKYSGGQADFTGTKATFLDLSKTNLTNITIADSETLKSFSLPDTIVGLTVKNCPNLQMASQGSAVVLNLATNVPKIKYLTIKEDVGDFGWFVANNLSGYIAQGNELNLYSFICEDWNTVNPADDTNGLSTDLLVALSALKARGYPVTITGTFDFTKTTKPSSLNTEVSMEYKRKFTWLFGDVDNPDNEVYIIYNRIETLPTQYHLQFAFYIEGGSYLGDSLTKDFIIMQLYGAGSARYLYTNTLSDIRIEGPQSSSTIEYIDKNPFELDAYRIRVTFREVPTSDMLLRIGVKIDGVWYNSEYKTFKAGAKPEVEVGDYIYEDLSVDNMMDYAKNILGYCVYLTPDNIPVYAGVPILYYVMGSYINVIPRVCEWGPSEANSRRQPDISLQNPDKYSNRIYDTLSNNGHTGSVTAEPSIASQMGISLDEIFSVGLFDRTIFEQSDTPHYPVGLLETATILKTRESILNDPTFGEYISSDSWRAIPTDQESEDTFGTLLNNIIPYGSYLRYPAVTTAVLSLPTTSWLPSVGEVHALDMNKCQNVLSAKYKDYFNNLNSSGSIRTLNDSSPLLTSTEMGTLSSSSISNLIFVHTGITSGYWQEQGYYPKLGAAPKAVIIPFFAINNSN